MFVRLHTIGLSLHFCFPRSNPYFMTKNEAVGYSEMWINMYQTTQRHYFSSTLTKCFYFKERNFALLWNVGTTLHGVTSRKIVLLWELPPLNTCSLVQKFHFPPQSLNEARVMIPMKRHTPQITCRDATLLTWPEATKFSPPDTS
jgi:hypothetical protein